MKLQFLIQKHYLKVIAFIGILSASLYLFYPSLNYYFFQDDWFVLNWVRTGDLRSFFAFRTDIVYWRPISMPFFFWIGKNIFGFDPFGFHLLVFLLHAVNIFLLGKLSYLVFKNKRAALVSSFLYATASFHFMSMSWLSLAWNIVGNFFLFTSLNFYLLHKAKNSARYLWASYAFFLCALASSEFAIFFPLLIIILELIIKPKIVINPKNAVFTIMSLVIISVYFFVRLKLFPIPAQKEYKIILDFTAIKDLFWYGLWFFNIPEELKYQIVISKLQITENFLQVARNTIAPVFLLFFTTCVSLLWVLIRVLNNQNVRLIIFAIIFFAAGLTLVLFLPNHSYPYYLSIPSLLFFIAVGKIVADYINKFHKKRTTLIAYAFIVSWLLQSFLTINLTKKIHWVTGEQNISRETVVAVKKKYPKVPEDNLIIIQKSSNQLKQALMDQNAFQVIYNSNEIKTIYRW